MSTEKGKIIVKNETQTFGSNGFRKRELVIETFSQYPQKIIFEFVQDKTELLDKFKIGDSVEISYNLNGREWVNPQGETKYFNSIQGWRIEANNDAPGSDMEAQSTVVEPPVTDEKSDLPF